jgi:hypothetical protein
MKGKNAFTPYDDVVDLDALRGSSVPDGNKNFIERE